MYQSETSKHREKLAPFCAGAGIDIGFGGDPIQPNAIRVDFPTPYARTGDLVVQLAGDARNLYWFQAGALDYVYSSHVLEDFDETETEPVLREWARVLKKGGRLILLLPDQQKYLAFCRRKNQGTNEHHSIEHFSLNYVKGKTVNLGLKVISEAENIDEYSFYVVFEKVEEPERSQDEVTSLKEEVLRLRIEKAALKEELRQTVQHLEKYKSHPMVKLLKKIQRFIQISFHRPNRK